MRRTILFIAATVVAAAVLSRFEVIRGRGETLHIEKTITVLESEPCEELFQVDLSVTGFRPDIPSDIVLVFDRSGSMDDGGFGCTDPTFGTEQSCEENGGVWGPQPLTTAQVAAKLFIDQLGAQDRVALVTYSTDAELAQSLTFDRDAVKDALDAVSAEGYTNIADGLEHARVELELHRRAEALPVIVLLSDGIANRDILPTCSQGNCGVYPCFDTCCSQNAIDVAQAAKDAGTYVFSIFLPNLGEADKGCTIEEVEEHGANTLRSVASGVDFFYHPQTPDALMLVYEFIATQIPPAATALSIVDEVAPEFEIVPGSITPDTATVQANTITWTLDLLGDETRTYQYSLRRSDAALPPGTYETSVEAYVTFTEWTGREDRIDFPQTYADVDGELCGEDCLGQGRASLLGKGEQAIGSPLKLKLAGAPDARYRLFMATDDGPVLVPGLGVFCLDFSSRQTISSGRLSEYGFESIWWTIPQDPELVGRTLAFQFVAEDATAPEGAAISNVHSFVVAEAGTQGGPCSGGLRELSLFGVARTDATYPAQVTVRAFETGNESNTIGEVTFAFDPNEPPVLPMSAVDGRLWIDQVDAYPGLCLVHFTLSGCGMADDRLPDSTTVEVQVGDDMVTRVIDTSCATPIGTGTRLSPFYVTGTEDVAIGICD